MKHGTKTRSQFYGLNFNDPIFSDTYLKSWEASHILNAKLSKGGGVFVRDGRRLVGTIPEEIIHTAINFKDHAGIQRLMLAGGKKIYMDVEATGSNVVSYSDLRKNDIAYPVCFMNHLFWFDGHKNIKFDGTNWTSFGLPKPSISPTVTDVGAGNLTGLFQYVYSYVYENSSIGYLSDSAASDIGFPAGTGSTVPIAGRKLRIQGLKDPTGNASYIRIFRRSNIVPEFRLVADTQSLGGNVDFDIEDDTLDADLGMILTRWTEGQPPILKGATLWKGRLFAWAGQFLYASLRDEPEKMYVEESENYNPERIDSEYNEDIVTAKGFGNKLVVWTKHHMFLKTGEDPENWQLFPYELGTGCIAPRSPVNCKGLLRWMAIDGIYEWNGENIPERVSRPIEKDRYYERGLLDVAEEGRRYVCCHFDKDRNVHLVSSPFGGIPFNQRTFPYYFEMENADDLSCWSIWDYGFADVTTMDNGDIIVAEPGGNEYWQIQTDNKKDFGVNIHAEYRARQTDLEKATWDKGLLKISPIVHTTSENPVTFMTHFYSGSWSWTDSFSLTVDGALWNVSVWNEAASVWETFRIKDAFLSYPQAAVGTRFSFEFHFDNVAFLNSFTYEYVYKRRAQQ